MSKLYVPSNMKASNSWAVRVFSEWYESRIEFNNSPVSCCPTLISKNYWTFNCTLFVLTHCSRPYTLLTCFCVLLSCVYSLLSCLCSTHMCSCTTLMCFICMKFMCLCLMFMCLWENVIVSCVFVIENCNNIH